MITKEIERLLNTAHNEAMSRNHSFLLAEHLLYAICNTNLGYRFLKGCDVDVSRLTCELELFFNSQKPNRHRIRPFTSVMVERIIKGAVEHSLLSEQEVCSVIDILVSMMKEKESYAVDLLKKQNLTRLRVMKQSQNFEVIKRDLTSSYESHNNGMKFGDDSNHDTGSYSTYNNKEDSKKKKEFQEKRKSQNIGEEKILQEFLTDLNEKFRQGKIDPLVGREEEMQKLLLILGRRKKNNSILVGDPGVGKTAIVEGLARQIMKKTIHEQFHEYQVYSLEMGSLLAGTKFRGDFEERMTRIFAILKKKRKCIIFIDEIHTLIGSGATSGSGLDASNLIKPLLTDGEVQVIGATTYKEYSNHFQKDSALNRRFEKVDVREPTITETIEILKNLAKYYEDFHQVRYPKEVLGFLPILSKSYFLEKKLPDAAIDIMDLVGSHTKLKKTDLKPKLSLKQRPDVKLKEVEKLTSKVSGIPLRKIEHKNRFQVTGVIREIKKKIFGQDHVIEAVIKSVKLSKLGLGESGPIGSFLFTGPTGVGKTELCRVLSHALDMHLLRLDMSEFMESHSVSKLIGAPPGYVGFNERSGELTEQISKHPYCLLLLDEIEKAHSDVVNTFLQVMDYGQLTDSSGRKVSFKNTLIVMTSNLGAEEMSSLSMGFTGFSKNSIYRYPKKKTVATDNQDKGNEAVKRFFRPEFRNRLNAVLRFHFLSNDTIKSIITKLVEEMNIPLAEKNLRVELEPVVIDYLINNGYDPKMGGRSIKRVFEAEIKERVADHVFSHTTDYFKSSSKSKKLSKIVLIFYLQKSSIMIRNQNEKL